MLSFLEGYNLEATHCLSFTNISITLLSINILRSRFSFSDKYTGATSGGRDKTPWSRLEYEVSKEIILSDAFSNRPVVWRDWLVRKVFDVIADPYSDSWIMGGSSYNTNAGKQNLRNFLQKVKDNCEKHENE